MKSRNLRNFIAGCFHEDWRLEASSYRDAVRRFTEREPLISVSLVRGDLEAMLASGVSDAELERLVLEEWGSSYDPASEDLTVRTWLEELLRVLRA